MKLHDLHGTSGFIVDGVSFRRLCDCIAQLQGVAFTKKRRFFWWAGDIHAEFTLHGNTFKVWPDPDDSGIWIQPKDEHANPPEILELCEHIASKKPGGCSGRRDFASVPCPAHSARRH